MCDYRENPKTKGSGIYGCFPQGGYCPIDCPECFFNNGRSYLEDGRGDPEANMPPLQCGVVRINDVGDSNIRKNWVLEVAKNYPEKFFNTSIPNLDFPGPVVLTINPAEMTDKDFHKIENPPKNLMFVRFRLNTWNHPVAKEAIDYYSAKNVPIVLTWMAYHEQASIPVDHLHNYEYRKRTLNSYWAIRGEVWDVAMNYYRQLSGYVYSCGNEHFGGGCKACGNCLREYFRTKEALK